MSVTYSRSSRVAVVRPQGELDLSCVDSLRASLADVLGRAGVRLVVVDLARVTFLDCSALRVLEEAASQARTEGTTVSVVHAFGVVARVIQLAGSADLLGVQLRPQVPERQRRHA